MNIGIAARSNQENGISGDEALFENLEGQILLGVIDGLGHGPQAKVAAEKAVSCIRLNITLPLAEILQSCDEALRDSRGAAIGLALVSFTRVELTYLGIGNTRIRLLGEKTRTLLSMPGIVGAGTWTANAQTIPYRPSCPLSSRLPNTTTATSGNR